MNRGKTTIGEGQPVSAETLRDWPTAACTDAPGGGALKDALLRRLGEQDRRYTIVRMFLERTRNLSDPDAILETLSGIFLDQLEIRHFLYGDAIDGDPATLHIFHTVDGTHHRHGPDNNPFETPFRSLITHYAWDQARVVNDNRDDQLDITDPVRAAADRLGVRSSIMVPIRKDGLLVGVMAVLHDTARQWSRDEIELCEDMAERIWSTVSRARVERELRERQRSQSFIIDWSDRVRSLTAPDAIMATTLECLGHYLNVTRATYSEADEAGRLFTIKGEWRDDCVMTLAGSSFSLDTVGAVVDREWTAGDVVRYDDIVTDPRIEAEVVESYLLPQIQSFVSVPLLFNGRVQCALSVQHHEARPWRDSEIAMLREIADRTWVSLARARAQAELEERERHQAFLIAWTDRLRMETSPDAILSITLEWLGRHLDITRVAYARGEEDGPTFTVIDEWRDGVGSSLGNRFAPSSFGGEGKRAWMGGALIRRDDIAGDPHITPEAASRYAAAEIGAMVSAPAIQDGEVRSILSVQHHRARHWRQGEVELVQDVAQRIWMTMERARVQAALQDRERHQAFLLEWNDDVQGENDARTILSRTLGRLGAHLGAARSNYAEAIEGGETLYVIEEWRDNAPSVAGVRYPLAVLGERLAGAHRRGQAIRVDDIATDPLFDEMNRPLFEALEIGAVMTLPMIRFGEIVAVLSVQHRAPHGWTDAEYELVSEVAQRTLAILERAQSEARLAESEAQLSVFLENAPLVMHLKDAEGRYMRINPEFARAMGRPVEELIDRHPVEIFPPHVAAQVEEIEMRARAGEVASAELDLMLGENYQTALSIVFPIPGATGRARTAGFAIDLTQRKRAEAALARSRDKLYQTEKLSALGSLLAGVSHELNNPLSIVVAQAVMMERQARGTDLARRAEKIRNAADRCARIVQTFLAMARQKRPVRSTVDLNAVALAAHELADYGLKTAGIVTERDLSPALPFISADADQLHQIIINLLVNAQQAMGDAGTAERRVKLRTRLGKVPGTVVLEVADSGPGIAEDARRRVFEPFFTTKPQGQGTGVGLSFSKGLAESHGGQLELVPSAVGACFRLTLPVDPYGTLEAEPDEQDAAVAAPPRRALVIDDEEEIAEALADFLFLEGFACDVAVGGDAAKERLVRGTYDLVVSDLRMPGIDGPQLYAWLAAERPEMIGAMAFTTGDTLGFQAEQFLGDVKRPVLEKPFTPEAVAAFLKQMDLA